MVRAPRPAAACRGRRRWRRRPARRGGRPARGGSPRSPARRAWRPGDLGDLVQAAGVLGEQLDDLALDEGGVDVHDDQPLGAPVQAALLDGDVDLLLGGLDGEPGAQRVRVGAGDVHLDAGDGVLREPLDAVDVGAVGGDPAGDPGHGGGLERVAEDGDVQPPAGPVRPLVAPGGQLDLHVEVVRDVLGGVPHPSDVGALGVGEQDAEDEPPRMTTCSTSATVSGNWESVRKRRDVTPGRSRPVSVMSSVRCADPSIRSQRYRPRRTPRPAGPACETGTNRPRSG